MYVKIIIVQNESVALGSTYMLKYEDAFCKKMNEWMDSTPHLCTYKLNWNLLKLILKGVQLIMF